MFRGYAQYTSYLAVALLLTVIDPFGLHELSDKASQDVLYQTVIGPLYPTDRRNETAVVIFDESSLERLGVTWPVSLGTHANVLRAIRRYNPKGVMVDFLFSDERDDAGLEAMLGEIAEYNQDEDVGPLVFAGPAGVLRIRSDLQERVTLVDVPNYLDYGVSRRYAPYRKDKRRANQTERPTAAFMLYQEVSEESSAAFEADMDIVWGSRLHPINDKWMRGCQSFGGDLSTVPRMLQGFFFPGSLDQPCPYTGTVSVADLVFRTDDEDIAELLGNSAVVFYGADLPGLGDVITTPTNSNLPGVYLHAMAYDNLLTFGDHYKKSVIRLAGRNVGAGSIEAVLAIVMILLMVRHARREPAIWRRPERKEKDDEAWVFMNILLRRRWYWLRFEVVMLLSVLVVAWILYAVADLSPVNWIGIFGLAFVMSALAQGRRIEAITFRAFSKTDSAKRLLFEEAPR